MRKAFVQILTKLAVADERIVLLTADLGYLALEPFRDRFPSRFFNVGVAEQNMVGVATGMAEAGFFPYTYSIASFAALRAFEFIRNGPVRHHLPVRMIGMGMGFEYGHAGSSHYALEDVAALRTQPGLTVVIPADSRQAAAAIEQTQYHDGPVYFSLGKEDQELPGLDGHFKLGRLQIVRQGADLALVAMGSISQEALAAAEHLSHNGAQATVAIVSSFNPEPVDDLAALLSQVPHVISLEAQTPSGGLAAFVSSVIASHGLPCRLWPLSVTALEQGRSGSPADCWRRHGINRIAVIDKALSIIGRDSL